MYNKIKAALAAKFVRSDEIARIIALAVVAGKNVLLWGPGGHGKSEMVTEALAQVVSFQTSQRVGGHAQSYL